MIYPLSPDPSILVWFGEPRSQTEVTRLTGYWRSTVYKHMIKARNMGLIHGVGLREKRGLHGPRHRLYELTTEGRQWLQQRDQCEEAVK